MMSRGRTGLPRVRAVCRIISARLGCSAFAAADFLRRGMKSPGDEDGDCNQVILMHRAAMYRDPDTPTGTRLPSGFVCRRMGAGYRFKTQSHARRIMPTTRISINQAPVLTLWAAVVAKRLGFSADESLGQSPVEREAMSYHPTVDTIAARLHREVWSVSDMAVILTAACGPSRGAEIVRSAKARIGTSRRPRRGQRSKRDYGGLAHGNGSPLPMTQDARQWFAYRESEDRGPLVL